jgi:hypothetical protein
MNVKNDNDNNYNDLHIFHPQLQYFIYEFSLIHIRHLNSNQTTDGGSEIYNLILFFNILRIIRE